MRRLPWKRRRCVLCGGTGLVHDPRFVIPDFCPDCSDGRRGQAAFAAREALADRKEETRG